MRQQFPSFLMKTRHKLNKPPVCEWKLFCHHTSFPTNKWNCWEWVMICPYTSVKLHVTCSQPVTRSKPLVCLNPSRCHSRLCDSDGPLVATVQLKNIENGISPVYSVLKCHARLHKILLKPLIKTQYLSLRESVWTFATESHLWQQLVTLFKCACPMEGFS